MSPPIHVKVVTLLINGLFLAVGLRDTFSPDTNLLPDDAKMIPLFFGNDKSNVPLQGSYKLVVTQMFCGCMLATVSAAKLATILTNPEGTFLRRNLMVVFGIFDVLFAYLMFEKRSVVDKANADIRPFAAMFLVEGAVFLTDALLRDRSTKPAARGKKK